MRWTKPKAEVVAVTLEVTGNEGVQVLKIFVVAHPVADHGARQDVERPGLEVNHRR